MKDFFFRECPLPCNLLRALAITSIQNVTFLESNKTLKQPFCLLYKVIFPCNVGALYNGMQRDDYLFNGLLCLQLINVLIVYYLQMPHSPGGEAFGIYAAGIDLH